MNRIKTFSAKPSPGEAHWVVIDATSQRLGRLATRIAQVLQGKHKPIYTPHVLTGDFVVVVNASKVDIGGNKRDEKLYYRHTGYPGGLRSQPLGEILERHPERVIQRAVKNMLPGSTLARQMLKRLKVYGGETHPHEAQVNAGAGSGARKRAAQAVGVQTGDEGSQTGQPRSSRMASRRRKPAASEKPAIAESTPSEPEQKQE